jgi:hypothetical protein
MVPGPKKWESFKTCPIYGMQTLALITGAMGIGTSAVLPSLDGLHSLNMLSQGWSTEALCCLRIHKSKRNWDDLFVSGV